MNLFQNIWAFLKDEQNKKTLSWIGGAIIAVVGVSYGAYVKWEDITVPPKSVDEAESSSTKGKCSPVIHGGISGGNFSLNCSESQVTK